MKTQTHSQLNATKPSVFTPVQGGLLQRKCACGNHTVAGGECAECAKNKTGLQRKLSIGASNDPLELEADRVAGQVMAAPANSVASSTPLRIQRYSGQASEDVGAAPTGVDRVLASSGRPLEPALQQDMCQRFGHDFSRVRVHSGGEAAQSAREVNANAYTVGHNIVFGAGRFAPGTHEGRRLIAHELTHVVQQTGSVGTRLGQGNEKRGLSPIPTLEGIRLISHELTHVVQQSGAVLGLASRGNEEGGQSAIAPKNSIDQNVNFRPASVLGGAIGTLQRQTEVPESEPESAATEPSAVTEPGAGTEATGIEGPPELSALAYRLRLLIESVNAVTRDNGPTMPGRTTEVGSTTCNPNTGQPEWRIDRSRIPQCMWPCAEHHEQTHAEFMRMPCERVWLPLERASFWIRIATQYARQGNIAEVERAMRESQAAVDEGTREVQWYQMYMSQTCRYDEATAYEAGIEMCDTAETRSRCTALGELDRYNTSMAAWRAFMRNPPNCPAVQPPARRP